MTQEGERWDFAVPEDEPPPRRDPIGVGAFGDIGDHVDEDTRRLFDTGRAPAPSLVPQFIEPSTVAPPPIGAPVDPYEDLTPLTAAPIPAAADPDEHDKPDGPELPLLVPPDNADIVREHLRRTKRGPLRRFTLYASGAEPRVLWYAPVEEPEYVVQGSLVILTAVVAGLSGLAAASFLTAGRFVLTPVTVLVGLVWGVLIFFFDRALVSGTFNPYRFTRAEVESLRSRDVETPWAHLVVAEDPDRRGLRRRVYEIIRVALVASLRVALALATSYIAAEMVLFLVFQPEVNARTAYLQQQLQAQRVEAVQAEFNAEAAKRAEERRQLIGAADPDVARLTQQTDELTTQLDAARRDLGVLQAAAAAELDGDRYSGTLADGTVVTTTGRRGDGAAARSLAQRRDAQQAVVTDLAGRLDRARAGLDARLAELKTANAGALTTLSERDNRAAADERAAVAAAMSDPSAVTGLLIRQAALDKLTNDQHPETLADDPVPACGGLFAPLCALRNWLVPPTPMGPAVVAYRVIFFVIEILPITYKVISSLRRRRPYDVAKAALEEASAIDAIRLVDRHLHDAAREVARRSDARLAPRTNGARPAPPGQLRDWINR